jgi:hypothetical protein
MAGPAAKATAAETPATKLTTPTIRGMNRLARIIRLFMKTPCMAREYTITLFPSLRFCGLNPELKVRVVKCTINRENNFIRARDKIYKKQLSQIISVLIKGSRGR